MKVVETKYGHMLASWNDKYIGKALIEYGEYSDAEVRVLLKMVPENGVAVDVGANIGAVAVPLARRAGIVIAFEPQRLVYNQLCGNTALNDLRNLYCLNRAAGREAGQVMVPELDLSREGNFGAMSLLSRDEFKDHEFLPVDMMTIDQLGLARLDLLKVDVEGMELDVLVGAAGTIERCRPHLCIENDRAGSTEPLVKWMVERRYTVSQHFPRLFNPDNHRKSDQNLYGDTVSANLIGFPGDLPGWIEAEGLHLWNG